MTFNSLQYFAFFLIVLGTVALLRAHLRARNLFLLGASWLFYAAWDWRFLFLLVGTSTTDYFLARRIDSLDDAAHVRQRKSMVAASVAINLTFLGFFKYFNFFADSLHTLLDTFGIRTSEHTLHIALPVGISFYVFQSVSYVIDVYRKHLRAEKDFFNFACFVAFFPQLVAGPIERATHLLPQIKRTHRITWDDLCHGTWLIGVGLFKKVVLADNVSRVANAAFDSVYSPDAYSSTLAIYAFAIQIFCDFSAYSDIARGSARCMGFDLMRNFDLPYFAVNPSDFWRRWHISLSTWLRDYLYIPLGGNRGGTFKVYRNLMLTMLIGGLWHGAAWTFVLWGLYHGVLLCVHRAFNAWTGRPKVSNAALSTVIRIAIFFQFTSLGWLLFRANTIANLRRMIAPFHGEAGKRLIDAELTLTLVACALALLLGQVVVALSRDYNVVFRIPAPARAFVYAAMMIGFILFGEYGGGQFIYFQF